MPSSLYPSNNYVVTIGHNKFLFIKKALFSVSLEDGDFRLSLWVPSKNWISNVKKASRLIFNIKMTLHGWHVPNLPSSKLQRAVYPKFVHKFSVNDCQNHFFPVLKKSWFVSYIKKTFRGLKKSKYLIAAPIFLGNVFWASLIFL